MNVSVFVAPEEVGGLVEPGLMSVGPITVARLWSVLRMKTSKISNHLPFTNSIDLSLYAFLRMRVLRYQQLREF